MSGTSYGVCILHAAPEAFIGESLALLKTADTVRLDLPNRRIDMLVSDAEIVRRKNDWKQPAQKAGRGYNWMYAKHILQADQGCDFDFLETGFGEST